MITKIEWIGYEGEHGSDYVVHPGKTLEEFENELAEIRVSINLRELPKSFIALSETFYELVLEELADRGYIIESTYIRGSYDVSMHTDYKSNDDYKRVVVLEKTVMKRVRTNI